MAAVTVIKKFEELKDSIDINNERFINKQIDRDEYLEMHGFLMDQYAEIQPRYSRLLKQ